MSQTPEKQLLPAIAMDLIERQMRQRDSLIWSRVGMKLAAGIPLALAGPLGLAVVLSIEGWIADWEWNSFTLWFLLGCGVMAAIAWKFLPRAQTRHTFAEEVMRIVSLTPEEAPGLDLSELSGKEPREAARYLMTIVLAGPRRLYEAWQLTQEFRAFSGPQRQRAAQVLQELSRQPTGIPWLDLRKDNESLPELFTVLGYLKVTDWVDLGTQGTKIWMLSDARKAAAAST